MVLTVGSGRATPPARPGGVTSTSVGSPAAGHRGGELVRRLDQQPRIRAPGPTRGADQPGERERAPVHRHREPRPQPGHRLRRAHRVEVAGAQRRAPAPDRQQRDVRAAAARPCRRTGRCRRRRRSAARRPRSGAPWPPACGPRVERGPQRCPLCAAGTPVTSSSPCDQGLARARARRPGPGRGRAASRRPRGAPRSGRRPRRAAAARAGAAWSPCRCESSTRSASAQSGRAGAAPTRTQRPDPTGEHRVGEHDGPGQLQPDTRVSEEPHPEPEHASSIPGRRR